jgi:hypothetical protein
MRIGEYEFPDDCPIDCHFRDVPQGQGGPCHRCPVFNCTGEFPLLSPEEYRLDWAAEWHAFFEKGISPILSLRSKS